jgi:hypothetical protein
MRPPGRRRLGPDAPRSRCAQGRGDEVWRAAQQRDQATRGPGRRRALIADPQGREVVVHACDEQLEKPFGPAQILERMLAEMTER